MSVRLRTRRAFSAALLVAVLVTAVAAAAPGDLDPSFGDGGVVVTARSSGAGADNVNGLGIQPDKAFVVGGSTHDGATLNFSLTRYTKHGDLDSTFGGHGNVGTVVSSVGDDHIWALALQPDGKILAGGHADLGAGAGGANFALARYELDGTLDDSFGGDGIVTTAVAPADNADFIQSIALQADSKVVAGGFIDSGPGAGGLDFALARYGSDGELDPTFGGDGVVTMGFTAGDGIDTVQSVAIRPDGKIVAGGAADAGPGAGRRNFGLLRLLPNGDLDPSFGSNGMTSTPISSGDIADAATAIALRGDGTIVAGGTARKTSADRDFALALYSEGGSLLSSTLTAFGSGVSQDQVFDLVVQPDGKIVLAGSAGSAGVGTDFALARYHAEGTLDESFGAGGLVTTAIAPVGSFEAIFGLELDKTGKIVAAGECDMGPATGLDECIARYKAADDE
jgi:uncharacterized delta-60 repeat protein